MAEEAVPPFDPRGCRYDQSTFAGRLQHFKSAVSPAGMLITREQVERSTALLSAHAKGEAPAGTTDAALWEAKRVKDAVIHPVTGEEMFPPGRMSAFVPMNAVPTVGMLAARTPLQTVFWQWCNQSVNVLVNYVNRSGASIDSSQVAQAYALAVGVSCGIAVGARKLVQSGPPLFKRLGIAVPYAAVAIAGSCNLAFTRMPEIQQGVPVADHEGRALGVSKAAAVSSDGPPSCLWSRRTPRAQVSSVTKTVLSRYIILPVFPLLLPPLAMFALRTAAPVIKAGSIAAIAAESTFVASALYFALPYAIAIFPQEIQIPVSELEPEFRELTDSTGAPIKYAVCNKGL